jgi:hypothetical protein
MPWHPMSLISILILSSPLCPDIPSGLSFIFSYQNPMQFSSPTYVPQSLPWGSRKYLMSYSQVAAGTVTWERKLAEWSYIHEKLIHFFPYEVVIYSCFVETKHFMPR